MLKTSASQWVNTVSLIRMVINLYSFRVKLRKGFLFMNSMTRCCGTFSADTRGMKSYSITCVP